MRVALFGGSFDPPHLGHLAVARAAAERFALDQVLFAPSGRQPLKPTGAVASFEDRVAMVRLLCAGEARFAASEVDAPRADGGPNYTVDTIGLLRGGLPEGAEVFVVVGADSFLDLRRWRGGVGLLDMAEWIVVSRPGFALDGLEALGLSDEQRKHVRVLQGVAEPVSATKVRRRLQAGEDCSEWLGATVFEYIRARGLYAK